MSNDFWDWYEENKLDLFWYKYKLLMGFDPEGNSTWLEEKRHWARVESIRKKYDEIDDPHRIFKIAPFIDLQYILEKWWDKLDRHYKEKYLIQTWFMKMDGHLMGLDWWLPYFEETGFIANCDVYRPTEPITLYRGSEPFFRKGMSWTNKINMAKVFADSESVISKKYLYGTVVQPESILAIVRGNAINTDGIPLHDHGLEYVINHQHLSFDDIYAVEDPEWDKVKKP